MNIKKYLFILIFSILFLSQTVYSIPSIKYEGYRDHWNLASYESLETERRQHYTDIIMAELDKYPDGFFERIGLNIILITKNLKFDNVKRGGFADNYSRILFISILNDYTDDFLKYIDDHLKYIDDHLRYADDYLIHAFHHEVNHYVEFSIWGDYGYDWDQWRILFTGRGGGGELALAYQNREEIFAILSYNPDLVGFLNYYSTLSQQEDRSEMMAFFLTEDGNRKFIEKAKRDYLFYQKAILLFTFYKENLNFNLLDVFLLRVNPHNGIVYAGKLFTQQF